jgi:hypothetical protein
MARPTFALPPLILVVALAACQRDATPGRDDTTPAPGADAPAAAASGASPAPANDDGLTAGKPPSTIAVPPADTPTPALAEGAEIIYTCEDGGELHVVYASDSAKFASAGGRVLTLPRAESASKGGGDVYVNDSAALQRLGNVVQVEEQSGEKRVCAEAGGTA